MTGDHQPIPAHLPPLLALMLLFWSVNFVVAKWVLREIPTLAAAGLRFAFAGLLIWPLYQWRRGTRSRSPRLSLHARLELLLLGIAGVGLNQLFYMFGIGRTSVAHASLVMSLIPILVLVMAAAIGQEQITRKKMSGMAVAIAGIALLQLAPEKAGGASLAGDAFILASAAAFAAFTVFGRGAVSRYDSLTVNTHAYAGSGLAMLPVTLWYVKEFEFARVSLVAWTSLLYMVVFPALVCYLIYYYALGFIPASKIAALSYLQPVLATSAAVLLLGEAVTMPVIGGGLLVLAGVLVAERA